jgi:hypothetical protein
LAVRGNWQFVREGQRVASNPFVNKHSMHIERKIP